MATNKLTPAQIELLSLLSEELGEAVQAIGKILRHGYESVNPHNPYAVKNREHLEKELGDVSAAIKLLCDSGDLNIDKIKERTSWKLHSVTQWLHEQEKHG